MATPPKPPKVFINISETASMHPLLYGDFPELQVAFALLSKDSPQQEAGHLLVPSIDL